MGGVISPYAAQANPVGNAGGDLSGTYPNPGVAAAHLLGSTSTSQVAQAEVTGDTNPRLTISANGNLAWGTGSGATDTDLYRNGSALLQTDGSLTIGTNATVNGTLNASASNLTSAIGFGGNYIPVVTNTPNTVTGTTALTTLLTGMVIPASGFVAGQMYEVSAWGVLTTTVDTQTIKIGLYLSGSDIMDFGALEPNPSAIVSGVPWQAWWYFTVVNATTVNVWGQVSMNYFLQTVPQFNGVAVSVATSKTLTIGVTNSANAVSITGESSYFMRRI